jgi:hypothetical protein
MNRQRMAQLQTGYASRQAGRKAGEQADRYICDADANVIAKWGVHSPTSLCCAVLGMVLSSCKCVWWVGMTLFSSSTTLCDWVVGYVTQSTVLIVTPHVMIVSGQQGVRNRLSGCLFYKLLVDEEAGER